MIVLVSDLTVSMIYFWQNERNWLLMKFLNIKHSPEFQKPHHPMRLSLTLHEHHPLFSSPYLPLMTFFQKASSSEAYVQHHFPNRALLSIERLLIPKPLFLFSLQTIGHFTKRIFSPRPLHPKESPSKFS